MKTTVLTISILCAFNAGTAIANNASQTGIDHGSGHASDNGTENGNGNGLGTVSCSGSGGGGCCIPPDC